MTAGLGPRTCVWIKKMEQKRTSQQLSIIARSSDLLDQLFQARTAIKMENRCQRDAWCQVDKTQAFHQLHQEQLCKLRLSIPSREWSHGCRGSLKHRATYGREHWRRQQVENRNQLNMPRHDYRRNEGMIRMLLGGSHHVSPDPKVPLQSVIHFLSHGRCTIQFLCPGNRVPWAKFRNFQVLQI